MLPESQREPGLEMMVVDRLENKTTAVASTAPDATATTMAAVVVVAAAP
jgi:hypothetical protein